MDNSKSLPIIGNNTLVTIAGIKNIPAKVDTGADSSSLWASNIRVRDDGCLEFSLLGKTHPLYTGELLSVDKFSAKQVRSSNGQVSIRYCTNLPMKIENKTINTKFTLSDRSHNQFPILVGRKTIQNKFLVDVSRIAVSRPATPKSDEINLELQSNPQKFHQKYMENQ